MQAQQGIGLALQGLTVLHLIQQCLLVLPLLLLAAEGLLQPLIQLPAPLPLPPLSQLLAVVVRQSLVDGQGIARALTRLPAAVGRGLARAELKTALVQRCEPGLPALPKLLPLLRGEGVHRLVQEGGGLGLPVARQLHRQGWADALIGPLQGLFQG